MWLLSWFQWGQNPNIRTENTSAEDRETTREPPSQLRARYSPPRTQPIDIPGAKERLKAKEVDRTNYYERTRLNWHIPPPPNTYLTSAMQLRESCSSSDGDESDSETEYERNRSKMQYHQQQQVNDECQTQTKPL